MNECKVCKARFEPWMTTFQCSNCDDGVEEIWRDWSFDGPDFRQCHNCHGEGEFQSMEQSFCSEDCREDYFNPNRLEF
jgi:hypothetical protein